MLNLPNALTILRILAVPVFLILLVDGRYPEALAVFFAAGVTDGLDGAIARLTHTKTALGANLDPAADKLLLVSSFIVLAFLEAVPPWLTVLVLSRDAILVMGYLLLFLMTSEAIAIRPTMFGKTSTTLQLLSVGMVLIRRVWPDLVPMVAETGLFYATGVVTSVAGLQYMHRGLAWLQARPEDRPGT